MTLIANVKTVLRGLIPQAVFDRRRQRIIRAFERDYSERSPREAFSAIYRRGLWGRGSEDRFYSGLGSHQERIVDAYVAAVASFVRDLPGRPDAVDLGCGDFNVGRRVSALCRSYVACDVVPDLIERNRAAFPEVDFRCLDIVSDALPDGDVAFVRQVLQHLSNAQIAQVVAKLGRYRWVVLTEHLPDPPDFVPNLDKPSGIDIRPERHPRSGVVLTEPPFNLKPRAQRMLCEVRGFGGVICTLAYEM